MDDKIEKREKSFDIFQFGLFLNYFPFFDLIKLHIFPFVDKIS